MGLTGGSGSLCRLTAAILPAAETTPAARVDCRRAFRNMVGRCGKVQMKRGSNCSWVQSGERGDWGLRCCLWGEQMEIFGRTVTEQSLWREEVERS